MEVRQMQPQNVCEPIRVNSPGSVREVMAVQRLKAEDPRRVTESGSVREVRP